jgi:Abortive infection C-terminus
MAVLTIREDIDLINFLGMEQGYVLDFSNESFKRFVFDRTGVNIYDDNLERYIGLSKARRLKAFIQHESDFLSGKLIHALIEYTEAKGLARDVHDRPAVLERLKRSADRLVHESPIENLDAVDPFANERSLSILVSSIRESVSRNEPEAALDRLHTFITTLLRDISSKHSISYDDKTPLHSLMGAYAKELRNKGELQSEMADRILKSSISILDSFNYVRNNHSFAHPNETLSPAESSFVVSAVLNVIKFICSIEFPDDTTERTEERTHLADDDEIPF